MFVHSFKETEEKPTNLQQGFCLGAWNDFEAREAPAEGLHHQRAAQLPMKQVPHAPSSSGG